MAKKAELLKTGVFQGTMITESGNTRIMGEDIVVGDNLLKDSLNQSQNNDRYMVKSYTLSNNLVSGKQYTYQIKATLSSEKKMIGVWVGGGSYCAGMSQKNDNGIYTVTFTASSNMADKTFINVYCSNNTGTQGSTTVTGTCVIHSIKLEEGSVATPWIPNSSDAMYSTYNFGSMDRTITDPIKSVDFYEI